MLFWQSPTFAEVRQVWGTGDAGHLPPNTFQPGVSPGMSASYLLKACAQAKPGAHNTWLPA